MTFHSGPVDGIEIRPAEPGDFTALVDVFGQTDFFENRIARQKKGDGVLLVTWSDGRPVGSVYLWLEPAEEPEIRRELPDVPIVNRLLVAESHRHRGIGALIMGVAEDRLRALGKQRVLLGVSRDNTAAWRLYHRLGYREWDLPDVTGRQNDLGSGPEAELRDTFTVMVKELSAAPRG